MIIYRTQAEERRAKALNLGPGLQLFEDDTGLPSIRVDSGGLLQGIGEALTPDECITVNGAMGWLIELTNQPVAKEYYDTFMRPWYDASPYRTGRLVGDIYVSGASNGALQLEYSLDPQGGTWVPAGSSPIYLPLGVLQGPVRGPWEFLVSGAMDDVAWRVVSMSGDGAASPIVGFVGIEFTVHDPNPVTTTRWYFRSPTPVFDPISEMPSMAGGTILCDTNCLHWWGDPCGASIGWGSPNPLTNLKSLLRTKGSAAAGVQSHTASGSHFDDVEGGLVRFVSPPLAAQTIYPFAGEIGISGQCVNGAGTGMFRFGVHVVRPGVGVVASFFSTPCPKSQIVRYDPRDWIYTFTWSSEVDIHDNDRIVVDCTARMETIGLVLLTEGVTLSFNGTSDNIVDGQFGSQTHGQNPASYITLPNTLLVLSEIA